MSGWEVSATPSRVKRSSDQTRTPIKLAPGGGVDQFPKLGSVGSRAGFRIYELGDDPPRLRAAYFRSFAICLRVSWRELNGYGSEVHGSEPTICAVALVVGAEPKGASAGGRSESLKAGVLGSWAFLLHSVSCSGSMAT